MARRWRRRRRQPRMPKLKSNLQCSAWQQADYGHQLRQKAFVLSRRLVVRTYVSDPQINFAKPAEN